ncbi:plasmid maintenance protein, partial [Borrelia persica]|uniref:plasmid maintenance protein n=1 Tax=Borrelia persica TaxID=44448 RepID=UPI0004649B65
MLSIAKDNQNFKYKDPKGQIDAILKSLVELNIYKNPHNTQTIRMSYVKLQISKMLKRYNRLLKVYWTINTKNTNYKQSKGIEEYSASDIQNIVLKLLENDYAKKVCKRTLELDIKLLNNLNLIKSKIIRFGKGKGSVAYYVQNMELMPTHKEAILEYLTQLLQDNLKDKFIIGNFDFDKPFDNEPKNINSKINSKTTKLIKEKIESKNNEQLNKNRMSIISHVQDSDDINKANISYKKEKNSKENSEMLLKKEDFYKKKKRDCKITRKDVETRLLSDYKISEKYVKQIKELSNNDSTYINALLNLEQAITDYGIEYSLEDILEHFLKQFANRYKHKVWMMMKRKDGIINDYEIIWEGRFRDWYSNKYKKRCVEKSVYGESICIGKKLVEKESKKATKNLRNHDTEKKAEKEKRRLELLKREAYLQKLFEQEAKERKERLRRA